MTVLNNQISELNISDKFTLAAPCIGRIVGTTETGHILVELDDKKSKTAKLVSGLNRKELANEESRGREVLLVFENGDPDKPIILGLMEYPLENLVAFELEDRSGEQSKEIAIDGKRITITAEDEVELKCGKGSITVRKDGKIIIKGTQILSRSSGPQRIKGASVSIN